jgi:hypothetical protein
MDEAEVSEVVEQTVRPRKPFKWNNRKEEAALLLSQDELTIAAIAEKVGVSKQGISLWRAHPEFLARIDAHIAEFRARVRRRGIAIIENRVAHLQRRHDLMNKIIEERGIALKDIPGGSTGLLVHNVKSIGSGETAERVDLYELDAALLSELRQHEKQAAQELNQWAEKSVREITGAGGGPIKIKYDLSQLTKEDWLAIREFRSRARISIPAETTASPNGN